MTGVSVPSHQRTYLPLQRRLCTRLLLGLSRISYGLRKKPQVKSGRGRGGTELADDRSAPISGSWSRGRQMVCGHTPHGPDTLLPPLCSPSLQSLRSRLLPPRQMKWLRGLMILAQRGPHWSSTNRLRSPRPWLHPPVPHRWRRAFLNPLPPPRSSAPHFPDDRFLTHPLTSAGGCSAGATPKLCNIAPPLASHTTQPCEESTMPYT